MKARNLLLFFVLAILGSACTSEDPATPTLSGEVIQDYQYTLITASDLQRACIAGAWTASCPQAVEGPALAARLNRYAEENEINGVACDGSGGNEPSEELRVHAGDQVKVFNAAGTLIGLTSAEPGISSAEPGGVSEVRAAADTVVIVVTCPLSFELQLTEESSFYSITVGGTPGPSYSASDLEERGWHVVLN